MPNLINWSAVENRIRRYEKQFEYETRSLALIHVGLESHFDLSPDEIADCITDGARDRGIDAVYVERVGSRERIHLINAKCCDKVDSADKFFPSNEVDKILSFIADLLSRNGDMQKSCNALLFVHVQAIWALYESGVTPELMVHLIGNMGALLQDEAQRFRNAVAPYRYVTLHEDTLDVLANSLIERETPRIDRQIRVIDNNYFERVDGNIRGLIATVEARELVDFIRDPADPTSVYLDLFNDNVRVYLTSKNKINRAILQSALSEDNAYFWYLNNGITMTCDSLEYPPGTRGPTLQLTNVQIVNGGQTSHTLFEAYATDADKVSRVLLLVRIYETRHRDISLKIAESTNSQTPIHSRDLRANDDVQKKLQQALMDLGYYYERKANEHRDQEVRLRIDAFAAGQAFAAYYLGFPEVAYKDKSRIFGDLYEDVFSEDTTAEQVLTAWRVLTEVKKEKRAYESLLRKGEEIDLEGYAVIAGSFHVAYAVRVLCIARKLDPNDVKSALGQVSDV